jgi:hypothetical protein
MRKTNITDISNEFRSTLVSINGFIEIIVEQDLDVEN